VAAVWESDGMRATGSDRVYLAGEAVGVDNPATAHGALISGWHAATELMQRLG
jgi:polyamine oxidase